MRCHIPIKLFTDIYNNITQACNNTFQLGMLRFSKSIPCDSISTLDFKYISYSCKFWSYQYYTADRHNISSLC